MRSRVRLPRGPTSANVDRRRALGTVAARSLPGRSDWSAARSTGKPPSIG